MDTTQDRRTTSGPIVMRRPCASPQLSAAVTTPSAKRRLLEIPSMPWLVAMPHLLFSLMRLYIIIIQELHLEIMKPYTMQVRMKAALRLNVAQQLCNTWCIQFIVYSYIANYSCVFHMLHAFISMPSCTLCRLPFGTLELHIILWITPWKR